MTTIATDYLDLLADAIIITDAQGIVRHLNPAARILFDEPQAQPITDTSYLDLLTLTDEQSGESINHIGAQTLAEGTPETAGNNALIVSRDMSSELPVDVSTNAICDAQGQIHGMIISLHDVKLSRFSRRQLSWKASHDTLTGLNNLLAFEQQAQPLLDIPSKQQHAILWVDLDHFQQLNDVAGAQVADDILIQTGEHIQSLVRSSDMVARRDADIFLVLLPKCDLTSAHKVANNIHESLSNIVIPLSTGEWSLSVSIGLTMFTDMTDASLNHLIYQAEMACMQAKSQGRNQVQLFNIDEHQAYAQRLLALQNSLTNNQFKLYYQRIQPLDGQEMPSCELLLRHVTDDGIETGPSDFLPFCERSGLIKQLDRWVIQQLLDMLLINPQLAEQFERIHINLSAYSFACPYFLDEIFGLLSNHYLTPSKLCFEVSQDSIMHNLPHTKNFMQQLSQLGCQFAVDDVNANLTLFSPLQALPISMLKIHGDLLDNVIQRNESQIVVKAITQLAQEMMIQTAAQHIENSEALCWVENETQVSYVQGYHIHTPEPIENLLF